MNAHIVQKTVLQINEQELCAVEKREEEETEPQFLRDSGINDSDEDDGEEHNR
jgi:hypothetical protein